MGTLFRIGILSLVCFALCFPLVFMLIGSIMDASELGVRLAPLFGQNEGFISFPVIPENLTFTSYIEVLIDSPGFHVLYQNSLLITVCTLVGQMIIGIPAAWGFAVYDFKGKNALFFVYIILMMLPFQVMLLPNYLVLNNMGLIDTHLAIIIPGAFSAFPVFIMRHFFQTIPYSLIEAARLEGANELQILLRIGIPLGKPGIFAVVLLGFFEYWNIVEQPLAFLRSAELWPLSLFTPAVDFAQASVIFASAVIAAIPAVLIFLAGKEHLEQGIGVISTKG
jgi:multiple sugar transport system permease protein